MRVEPAILAALALHGCGSFCPQSDQQYHGEADVDYARIREAIEQAWVEDSDGLACSDVCIAVFSDPYVSGQQTRVITCEHELTEVVDATYLDTGWDSAAGDEERIIGHVDCTWELQRICKGRRPLGHVERTCADAFAAFAHLEAASVVAFQQLVQQLRGWGAPETLVARCVSAAQDEVVHAVLMSRLAKAPVPAVQTRPVANDLLAAAVHNAVEGCVHETWSALLLHLHAERADNAYLRGVFRRIAADETRHAQLAWDLHAWFLTRVRDAEVVLAAQRAALLALPEIARSQSLGLPGALGRTDPDEAQALATTFAEGLRDPATACP